MKKFKFTIFFWVALSTCNVIRANEPDNILLLELAVDQGYIQDTSLETAAKRLKSIINSVHSTSLKRTYNTLYDLKTPNEKLVRRGNTFRTICEKEYHSWDYVLVPRLSRDILSNMPPDYWFILEVWEPSSCRLKTVDSVGLAHNQLLWQKTMIEIWEKICPAFVYDRDTCRNEIIYPFLSFIDTIKITETIRIIDTVREIVGRDTLYDTIKVHTIDTLFKQKDVIKYEKEMLF